MDKRLSQPRGRMETFTYDDKVVRNFILATLTWGFVAFLLGVIAALQLANWRFNFGLQWITFGRLRPLHTNAAIFAFAGNAVFAGIYYSTQRLCKRRLMSDLLSKIHFWGWQAIIVSAALTILSGITVGKEYAELEWPIDIAIAVVWVVFAVNTVGTIIKRREKHIYVALWFYIATILTVALLHIVNSISIPVSFWKSYPVYAGVQDALVQWWYGHNAVAFFLTTPFLGLMYYFLPKAVGKPVYSYKLSVIHFWSLVFLYIWAGPHHLLYTALPEWSQTLGMVFSVMLWAPSWGGMINGLLTLRGAWDRVRTEPILKFFATGITFYGMATFEGPLLSIKSVSALAHYTDWIIGHVHSGALGWNGFISFAIIYWMVPKLYKTKLHSEKLANAHFWTATIGILLYMTSMWASGITQGLMLRAIDPATGKLMYPDFVQTVMTILPLYYVRAFAGILFITGFVMMLVNIYKTIKSADGVVDETYSAPVQATFNDAAEGLKDLSSREPKGHRFLEGLPVVFIVLTLIAVLVGSIIELVPTFMSDQFVPKVASVKPYTPLELEGRDLYVREGCYVCHSQMIRPLEAEVMRYGDYSKPEESQWDHPFQWGSRRTGPDLARVGAKYPALWHYRHMLDPREVTPGSLMPMYPWLFRQKTDFDLIRKKVAVMKQLGVPYSELEVKTATEAAKLQAAQISQELQSQGIEKGVEEKEIVALIAYLRRLGVNN